MDYREWVSALGESLSALGQRIAAEVPRVLGAALLVFLGYLLGRLLARWSTRLVDFVGGLFRTRIPGETLARTGIEKSAAEVLRGIIFWIVLLVFVTAATEILGLPVLAAWLSGISTYLPRAVVALLIVLAGFLAGNLARDAIATAAAATGATYGTLLGGAAKGVILVIALVTAVDQMGVDSLFLTVTVAVVLGALIGGAALAFGLGARTVVSNIIATHYLRQTYHIGQTVRVGDVEGRITSITNTAVLLDTAAGQVSVPAKAFGEVVSVLVPAKH
jgi:small-conductance mechanosensitive channel